MLKVFKEIEREAILPESFLDSKNRKEPNQERKLQANHPNEHLSKNLKINQILAKQKATNHKDDHTS